ncbi:MAG: adenylosuccinate lyase [Bacteroidia bacterium]|nr:adenylosuccinate lyase [Bacteroidia bacterium]
MITAISPLDGRYSKKIAPLNAYFSEYALIKYRIWVEVEYFIALNQKANLPDFPPLSASDLGYLRGIYLDFTEQEALRVKEIEKVTNHDVKAVEYFIKEKITESNLPDLNRYKEMIHFGLTSQDVNNTATPGMLRDALRECFIPEIQKVTGILNDFARQWQNVPMLAYTHGQPASPTMLGKEIKVFAVRLENQIKELSSMEFPAKFGGATGNMNAHIIAYPSVKWNDFAFEFVEKGLGLTRSYPTTQIEHYDGLARVFHCIQRINSIMTDLAQDMWLYISKEYFRQKTKEGEIGSSAMPHKVNPIDFENAEGNCGMSTAILEFLSRKLPVSRLQRDLTDSTVSRNIGSGIAYSYLAALSVQTGLNKLLLNPAKLAGDLDANWAVLAEPIQTILRREGYPNPYEALKTLTRGKEGINEQSIREFITSLSVSDAVKTELLKLRPENYTGDAGF